MGVCFSLWCALNKVKLLWKISFGEFSESRPIKGGGTFITTPPYVSRALNLSYYFLVVSCNIIETDFVNSSFYLFVIKFFGQFI